MAPLSWAPCGLAHPTDTGRNPSSPKNQSGGLTQTRADLNIQAAHHLPSGRCAFHAHRGDAQRPLVLPLSDGGGDASSPENSTPPSVLALVRFLGLISQSPPPSDDAKCG